MSLSEKQSQACEQFKRRLRTLLDSIKVSDLPAETRPLVVIDHDMKLEEAFAVLLQERILSAPVARDGRGYEGFLELKDLAGAVVSSGRVKEAERNEETFMGDVIAELKIIQGKTTEDPDRVSNLDIFTPTYIARMHPLTTVQMSTTLLNVCALLGKRVRRVAVVNESDKIVRILSQSWLMDALNDLMEEIHTELGAVHASFLPISAFGIVPNPVYHCTKDERAITAFKMMTDHNISCVPVVDSRENETLLGYVSSASLQSYLHARNQSSLDMTLMQFMQHEPSIHQLDLVCIQPEETVDRVFRLFAQTRSHWLFLVGPGRKLMGICSLKDVLAKVLREEND